VPPTAVKARTGEFTPPGVTDRARANSASDVAVGAAVVGWEVTGPLLLLPGATTNPGRRPVVAGVAVF